MQEQQDDSEKQKISIPAPEMFDFKIRTSEVKSLAKVSEQNNNIFHMLYRESVSCKWKVVLCLTVGFNNSARVFSAHFIPFWPGTYSTVVHTKTPRWKNTDNLSSRTELYTLNQRHTLPPPPLALPRPPPLPSSPKIFYYILVISLWSCYDSASCSYHNVHVTLPLFQSVDVEMRKFEVEQANEHIKMLNSFMPDSFLKRGGELNTLRKFRILCGSYNTVYCSIF